MRRSHLVLVLGGARSGKSRYAESLVAGSGHAVCYIATAGPPRDEEMAARIRAHRARRPANWCTVDEPLALAEALRGTEGVALVDCLTLWLTNLTLAEGDATAATQEVLAAIAARGEPVVAVSNEVGEGIVPATPLGRTFRDAQGVLNQQMAAAADHVIQLVAGCPILVKPRPDPEITL